MKIRIDKKIHYKYLTDIFLEFGLNDWAGIPVNHISVDENILVDYKNIPESF